MKIKISFLGIVSDYTNIHKTELELDDDKILFDEAVNIIREKYLGLKKIEKRLPIIVLLNGRKASSKDIVENGDEIAFIPPASGG